MDYMPNPAATNFPTTANAVTPAVFNLFDLYAAKRLPRGCGSQ